MKTSRDSIERRHSQILQYLREHMSGSVVSLADSLQVSQITIRRDLDCLESKGLISRFFGGAQILDAPLPSSIISQQSADTKKRVAIAKKAAEFLEDGDTVFFNSSSTALNVYQFIEGKRIIIITNNGESLTIPRNPGVELVLTGGEVYGTKNSLVGEYALSAIAKVKCNKCIIGVSGISVDGGITSSILPETAINRAMIANSTGSKIVVADSSKIGTVQNFHSSDLSSITHLITNTDADEQEINKIRKLGIKVIFD